MSNGIDLATLARLADPFPADDIEWRVSRAGVSNKGIYCNVIAYITARAIQERLDEVCGPENWRNEFPQTFELRPGLTVFVGGISIRIDGEWITKWDLAEQTQDNEASSSRKKGVISTPAKGGFSGAMKRAGTQWGIGRYLYYVPETFAEVSDTQVKGWNFAQLVSDGGRQNYWWKTPDLPGFALPREPDCEINREELGSLKKSWRVKFAPDVRSPADLRDGWERFVRSTVGEFPHEDYKCWTRDIYDRIAAKIAANAPGQPDSDIPFEENTR
jgi:hypothetical protein